MAIVDGSLQLGYKDNAWFTANASLVLLEGQIVYLEQTGTYKLGDGVTVLSALSFLGGGSGSGVQSVSGTNVDNTDPLNPVVNTPTLQEVTDEGATTTQIIQPAGVSFPSVAMDNDIISVLDSTDLFTLFSVNRSTDTVEYKEVEVETKPTQKTGTALTFENNAAYGTIASPETGNITFSTTGANLMTTLLVIHNSGTAPTFAANMRETNVSKGYSTGVINYILVTYINSTEVIYTIFQRA